MNYSPAKILQYALIDAGHGVLRTDDPTGDWPIFTNQMPDKIDLVISVMDTSGLRDGRYNRTGKVIEFPGVQIMVRALNDVDSFQKAKLVKAYLETIKKVEVDVEGVLYIIENASTRGNIIPIPWGGGQEYEIERKRFVQSINLLLTVYPKVV